MKSIPQLKNRILDLVRAPGYQPLRRTELSRVLGPSSGSRLKLDRALSELEQAGEIARIRRDRYVLPANADLVTGRLQVHPAGYAFLTSEKQGQPEIFIAAENTGTAMNGDRVVARITRDTEYAKPKKPSERGEGRVIRILHRENTTLVGTLQRSRNFWRVVPDDPRLVHNVYVRIPQTMLRQRLVAPNDKVVVYLDAWDSRHVNPEGTIVEVLGPKTKPGVDMLSIIRRYHLPTEFPRDAANEAEQIPEEVEANMIEGREDLRTRFIVTIDPDDAQDFDDAIDVEEVDNRGWQLGVHIADVSRYVKTGTALDREALRRGNSVYLPGRVIPMLPERLSHGVCSLNQNVDRLTHSVFLSFTQDGQLRKVRFAKTVIRSVRRLTYHEAYELLKKPPGDELSERLHLAWRLASLLRRKRFKHGSLDLDFPEVKIHSDKKGNPIDLQLVENDESHQLIEEFMLVANEAVARFLRNRHVSTIYRVHDRPDEEKLAEFGQFVLTYRYQTGDLRQRVQLQRLLAFFRGKPEERAIKIALLKSLKRARYSPDPLGHYGLAKTNYAHFTSPIRRYADLVVHRALAFTHHPRSPYSEGGQLKTIAEHISATERIAAEAEADASQLKKLEFFQRQLDSRNPRVFHAIIIDVRNYGLLVELPDALITGLVHVSALTTDFFTFDPVQRRLIGRHSRHRFSIGDRLNVFVVRVDQFKRQVDFAVSDEKNPSGDRRAQIKS